MKRLLKRGGFTLLELLITTSLFAVVLVVVASVFATALIAWRRAEGESEFYQELRIAFDRMGVELRNGIPYEGIQFEGKETLISFGEVRTLRAASPEPEWVRVTYEAKKDSGSFALARRIDPLLKKGETEDILFANLKEIHFAYPGFSEAGNWDWKENWDPGEAKGLSPPFIRIALVTADGERWEKIFWIPTGSAPPSQSESEGSSEAQEIPHEGE